MLRTPRNIVISVALLWGVAYWLQAQTVPTPTSVTENFKTVSGKEYKDATVSRVEPDGIVLRTKSGMSKVYFAELPKEVQERFHYDAAKAAQFTTAEQAGAQAFNAQAVRQQQESKRVLDQQVATAAQERQRQTQQEQIAAQQEQRQLEARQKKAAKIAAQKQTREQHQRRRRTTADGGYSWESYTRYNSGGGYESLQHSGNARAGSYHHESHGSRSSNAPWTDSVTDASWGPR